MDNEVKEEVKVVEPKKKGNGLFTLFACIMTGIIVFLASNIGQKASKVVDPDTKSGSKESNVTSNVESNTTSNIESNVTSNVDSNVTSNVVSNSNVTSNNPSNVVSNSNTTSNINNEVTVRTYRFFGYTEESDADQYTTLKLYSNNKYALFVNICSGVSKYTGTYTENNSSIVLTGSKNMTFTKKDKGTTLSFDANKLNACNVSGGHLSLESKILDANPRTETTKTRSYRFFGYLEGSSPDQYTTLKLYPDKKYVLYLNMCEGVQKITGTYTENKSNLVLSGGKKATFTKKNNGTSLGYKESDFGGCANSGGGFSLESSTLGE